MAGAAISPPATKAVEPSRSFFIILPLSLIRNWYVPKGLSDRRKWKPGRSDSRAPPIRPSNRTLRPNKGQEMVAALYDSPRTCGVFVTFRYAPDAIFRLDRSRTPRCRSRWETHRLVVSIYR